MIQAGKLRQRVTIQSPATGQDDMGAPTLEPWVLVAEVWAGIEPLSGSELEQARRVVADVTHRVTLRYRDGLNANSVVFRWRLLLGTRVFQIESVINPGENLESLDLLCREVV